MSIVPLKVGFENHMNSSHGAMRDFRCDLCDYSSIFQSKLEWHKKHSHAEKRPSIMNSLQQVKPVQISKDYDCLKCSFTSTLKIELEKHIKRSHVNKIVPGMSSSVWTEFHQISLY